jgi:hypothetical protein
MFSQRRCAHLFRAGAVIFFENQIIHHDFHSQTCLLVAQSANVTRNVSKISASVKSTRPQLMDTPIVAGCLSK